MRAQRRRSGRETIRRCVALSARQDKCIPTVHRHLCRVASKSFAGRLAAPGRSHAKVRRAVSFLRERASYDFYSASPGTDDLRPPPAESALEKLLPVNIWQTRRRAWLEVRRYSELGFHFRPVAEGFRY